MRVDQRLSEAEEGHQAGLQADCATATSITTSITSWRTWSDCPRAPPVPSHKASPSVGEALNRVPVLSPEGPLAGLEQVKQRAAVAGHGGETMTLGSGTGQR